MAVPPHSLITHTYRLRDPAQRCLCSSSSWQKSKTMPVRYLDTARANDEKAGDFTVLRGVANRRGRLRPLIELQVCIRHPTHSITPSSSSIQNLSDTEPQRSPIPPTHGSQPESLDRSYLPGLPQYAPQTHPSASIFLVPACAELRHAFQASIRNLDDLSSLLVPCTCPRPRTAIPQSFGMTPSTVFGPVGARFK